MSQKEKRTSSPEKLPEFNNKLGGSTRAKRARESIQEVFSVANHPLYFAKDIDFARKYDVSRHTIYKIRKELGIKPRAIRILSRLKKMELTEFTLKDLEKTLHIKYQNLYKIILENGLKVKQDVLPIEFLKRYQRNKKDNSTKGINFVQNGINAGGKGISAENTDKES